MQAERLHWYRHSSRFSQARLRRDTINIGRTRRLIARRTQCPQFQDCMISAHAEYRKSYRETDMNLRLENACALLFSFACSWKVIQTCLQQYCPSCSTCTCSASPRVGSLVVLGLCSSFLWVVSVESEVSYKYIGTNEIILSMHYTSWFVFGKLEFPYSF